MLSLPSAIPVAALLPEHNGIATPANCHAEYRPNALALNAALYEGGATFEPYRAELLWRREVEALPGGERIRAGRLAVAAYKPHAAGIVDFVCSRVCGEPLVLEGPSPFWSDLSENADGTGRSLTQLCRDLALDATLHGRAYVGIRFPARGDEALNLETARAQGLLDARFTVVAPAVLDDWGVDSMGQLAWARLHMVSAERDLPYGPMVREVHTWAFHEPEGVTYFRASRPLKNGVAEMWPHGAQAKWARMDPRKPPHVGVYAVQVPPGGGIMERLASAAIVLWNKESGKDWLQFLSCHPTPVFKTQRAPGKLFSVIEMALVVDPTEDFAFIQPSPQIFAEARSDVEAERKSLYSLLTAYALQQGQRDTQGRQSGKAKEIEFEALDGLIAGLRGALEDALLAAARALATVRGEDPQKVSLVRESEEVPEPVGAEAPAAKEKEEAVNPGEEKPSV